jgi:hypothetical protein
MSPSCVFFSPRETGKWNFHALVLAMIKLKNCSLGVKQQSITEITNNCFLIVSDNRLLGPSWFIYLPKFKEVTLYKKKT